ncbi:hypothetical protein DLM45_13270 [Hyphomicrobium methylovorum]|uniref:hypothetical protein n=1 Tax=Hyphomicrobium methylovorum TaxID=84 RepID=UPI0015E7BB29|nr:hypothetical protein [Hyphomicrobium methylovorum]MBA2127184.1 hypothetical protein [Hyphomicrobium methylovorum]
MSIFASHEDKAHKALDTAVSHHALAVASLDAHRLAPADPGDFSAIKEWDATDAALARDVDIAAGVVTHWQGVAARLDEEAAKKAAAGEKIAAEKEVKQYELLVREIVADSVKMKAKIDKLEAHRERARAAGVDDAEMRVRRKPGRVVPAITETVAAWFDPTGRRFGSDMTHDANGLVVKAKDRMQREVVDTIREEHELPGEMPTRFANAIKLVGLEGHPL